MLVRKGECKRCGHCCMYERLLMSTNEDQKDITYRRTRATTSKEYGEEGLIVLIQQQMCPYLSIKKKGKDKGKYMCRLHPSVSSGGRPEKCDEYPKNPGDQLSEDCGYYWEEEDAI